MFRVREFPHWDKRFNTRAQSACSEGQVRQLIAPFLLLWLQLHQMLLENLVVFNERTQTPPRRTFTLIWTAVSGRCWRMTISSMYITMYSFLPPLLHSWHFFSPFLRHANHPPGFVKRLINAVGLALPGCSLRPDMAGLRSCGGLTCTAWVVRRQEADMMPLRSPEQSEAMKSWPGDHRSMWALRIKHKVNEAITVWKTRARLDFKQHVISSAPLYRVTSQALGSAA